MLKCGKVWPMEIRSRCPMRNGILETRYDMRGEFPAKPWKESIWDFAEFLPPVRSENIVSLGEGWTSYLEALPPRIFHRYRSPL